MKDRVILHCDCNSFFASVEMALNPSLKGLPVAVCGDEENRHGIVLAKNEIAKKHGIYTTQTVYAARKMCPGLVVVKPHYSEYERYSVLVNSIYSKYTDIIEPFGIDESWLDVTASGVFGTGLEIAEKIRTEVKEKIGITVSIGVSFNKVFAKLGSDYKKPDAITVIDKSNFKDVAYPLSVGNLLFVGKKTEEQLKNCGIKTIGDLARANISLLTSKFGKAGRMLSDYARGLDTSPVDVDNHHESKNIGNGLTFRHDLVTRESCRVGIDFLCEELGFKLRKRNKLCSTVQLTIKDSMLKSIQRQRIQNPPTNISDEIAKTAYAILCDEWESGKPVRMLTVTVSGLIPEDEYSNQLSFFESAEDERRKRDGLREEAIDSIRGKFGNTSIVKASLIDNDMGIFITNNKK